MALLAPTVTARSYQRREPEHSLLWQLVAAEAPGLREAIAAARTDARGLPRHVDKEIDAFLECGQLSGGFARVVCRRCRAEHLVAFSCKGRGLCPSFLRQAQDARRMSDTAAHLVDRVLPHSPYRQWVVTFSRRVRRALAVEPKLASAALQEVLRTIVAWQWRGARRQHRRPARAHSNAAVTFVQTLLDRIIDRVTGLLRKRSGPDEEVDVDDEPHLRLAQIPAAGEGAPAFTSEPLPRLCARKDGFSLHAGRAVHKNDRAGLEQLCR